MADLALEAVGSIDESLAVPSPYSLEASAVVVEDLKRMNTFHWNPDYCSGGGVVDPCVVTGRAASSGRGTLEYNPFAIWAGAKCSAFGFADFDYKEKARRLTAATESYWLEREFWRGDLAIASGWSNRYLTSTGSDVLSAGATDVVDALACLEDGLSYYNRGAVGMIHATKGLVTWWRANNLVDRVPASEIVPGKSGFLLSTINGTIVVSGDGYDGSGPTGVPASDGHVWAYATGMVLVRLSPLEFQQDSMVEAMDRATNTVEFQMHRLASVTFDQCAHLAMEVNISKCDIGGPGS